MTERLQDSFFRALFHSPVGGIAVVDLDSIVIVDANEVMLEIVGRTRGQFVGRSGVWREITPEEYAEENNRAFQQAVERGYSDPLIKHYIRPDGTRVPVRTIFGQVPDYPDRLVVFATDITEEWNRQQEAEERERRLNIALSAAEQGIWDYNLKTGEMIYSARAKEIYGLPVDEPVTFEQIRDATHPADYPNTSALLLRAIDPAIRDRSSYEYRILRPDGSICWALAYGEAVFEGPPDAEHAIRYVGTLQDISERKQAESRQKLLVAELNHRVKNTLAIVQSFAHQSLGEGRSLADGRKAFEARLAALAAAHDLLTHQSWDEIGIDPLVRSSLRAHDDGAERVVISGPNLRLTPKTAVTLAMTLHELATNATKYGALSVPGGSARLDWSYEDGCFRMRWQEQDGPPVEEPVQRGFGTRMLERALASEIGGKTSLVYSPEGFRFELEAEAEEPL